MEDCNTLQHRLQHTTTQTATHCNTQCIKKECEIPDGLDVVDVDGIEPLFTFTAHDSEGWGRREQGMRGKRVCVLVCVCV